MFNIVLQIVSLLVHLVQISADITLCVMLNTNSNVNHCLPLMFFPVVSTVVVQTLSAMWFREDFQAINRKQQIIHYCLLAIVYRYTLLIYRQNRGKTRSRVLQDTNDLLLLEFFHLFLWTLPQLCVQMHLLVVSGPSWMLYISLTSALASMVVYTVRYLVFVPELECKLNNYEAASKLKYGLRAAARLFTVTFRVTTVLHLMLIVNNHALLSLIVGIHLIAGMLVIVSLQLNNNKNNNDDTDDNDDDRGAAVHRFKQLLYYLVFSWMFIIDFITICKSTTKTMNTTLIRVYYYTFIFLENVSVLILYGVCKRSFTVPAVTAVTLFTILLFGAMLMAIYLINKRRGAESTNKNQKTNKTRTNIMNTNKHVSLRKLYNVHMKQDGGNKTSGTDDHKADTNTRTKGLDDDDVEEDDDVQFHSINNDTLTPRSPMPDAGSTAAAAAAGAATVSSLMFCSPVDLNGIDATEEIMSTHDYENMCAVNINRGQCGLRSWQGYLDIDAYLHDDSTVHEDHTWTTSSERSCKYDYIESMDFSSQYAESNDQIYSIAVGAGAGALEPIQEEDDDEEFKYQPAHSKYSTSSISTLVATIDEIRHAGDDAYRKTPLASSFTLDQILFLSELVPEPSVMGDDYTTMLPPQAPVRCPPPPPLRRPSASNLNYHL